MLSARKCPAPGRMRVSWNQGDRKSVTGVSGLLFNMLTARREEKRLLRVPSHGGIFFSFGPVELVQPYPSVPYRGPQQPPLQVLWSPFHIHVEIPCRNRQYSMDAM